MRLLNSNTCNELALFVASTSCKMILPTKSTSTFFSDNVFSLLRTSILESLAAVVVPLTTDLLINLLKSVYKIVYNSPAMSGSMGSSD